MKILVCISKTPDTTAKQLSPTTTQKFADAGVQSINEALMMNMVFIGGAQAKESGALATVTTWCMLR